MRFIEFSTNLKNVVQSVMIEQGDRIKNLDANQLKVKSLEQQRLKYAKAEKQEKARQALLKAQKKVRDAMN